MTVQDRIRPLWTSLWWYTKDQEKKEQTNLWFSICSQQKQTYKKRNSTQTLGRTEHEKDITCLQRGFQYMVGMPGFGPGFLALDRRTGGGVGGGEEK